MKLFGIMEIEIKEYNCI